MQVNVFGQRDALPILAGLIADFTHNGERAVFQFTESLGKRSHTSKLLVLHFKDVVVEQWHLGEVARLAHRLDELRGMDVEHRGQRSQVGHFGGIDVKLRVDGSRSNQVKLVLIKVFNGKGPLHRVDDLSLHPHRHDGNESHQQAEKQSFHTFNVLFANELIIKPQKYKNYFTNSQRKTNFVSDVTL